MGRYGGVVDADVQLAKALHGRVHDLVRTSGRAHVGDDGHDVLGIRLARFGQAGSVAVGGNHLRACLHKPLDQRPPDAARRAGHDGHLSLKVEGHYTIPLVVFLSISLAINATGIDP